MNDVSLYRSPRLSSDQTTANQRSTDADWQVLVLFADDTEKDIKGIWGPYTCIDAAEAALIELRQWPLDGFWDVRRLNKFVAAKAGNAPDSTQIWHWQTGHPVNARNA